MSPAHVRAFMLDYAQIANRAPNQVAQDNLIAAFQADITGQFDYTAFARLVSVLVAHPEYITDPIKLEQPELPVAPVAVRTAPSFIFVLVVFCHFYLFSAVSSSSLLLNASWRM